MKHDSSKRQTNRWLEHIPSYVTAVSTFVVAIITARIAIGTSERDASVRLVDVAVRVLQAGKADSTDALRLWAVQLLAHESPVPLSKELRDGLIRGRIRLPETVAWSSSDPHVATVSPSGVITALEPGITTITATLGSGKGSVPITVESGKGVERRPNSLILSDSDRLEVRRVPKPR